MPLLVLYKRHAHMTILTTFPSDSSMSRDGRMPTTRRFQKCEVASFDQDFEMMQHFNLYMCCRQVT